jgi:hypothetical protein|tara:strand:- start:51 stop:293 length:243 start_codon:yes stop_codon:yes gene_type:complete
MGLKFRLHLTKQNHRTPAMTSSQKMVQHIKTDVLTMALDDISEELMATSSHDPGFQALEEVHDLLVHELAKRGRWDMESA